MPSPPQKVLPHTDNQQTVSPGLGPGRQTGRQSPDRVQTDRIQTGRVQTDKVQTGRGPDREDPDRQNPDKQGPDIDTDWFLRPALAGRHACSSNLSLSLSLPLPLHIHIMSEAIWRQASQFKFCGTTTVWCTTRQVSKAMSLWTSTVSLVDNFASSVVQGLRTGCGDYQSNGVRGLGDGDRWLCPDCTLLNDSGSAKCAACEGLRQGSVLLTITSKPAKDSGFSISDLHEAGLSASELKAIGFSAKEVDSFLAGLHNNRLVSAKDSLHLQLRCKLSRPVPQTVPDDGSVPSIQSNDFKEEDDQIIMNLLKRASQAVNGQHVKTRCGSRMVLVQAEDAKRGLGAGQDVPPEVAFNLLARARLMSEGNHSVVWKDGRRVLTLSQRDETDDVFCLASDDRK